jgi:hypothetical protein
VLPLVLYTGAGPWQNNRTLHDLLGEPAEFHGFVPQWGPVSWELSEQNAEGLLESGDAWQQMLAVLRAQNAEPAAFERVFTEATRRLEGLGGQDHVRWYDLMRIVLSGGLWRRPRAEQQTLLAAAQAMQTNVNRQQEVTMIGKSMGETIWEEGWTKGSAEGELRASRRMLRRVLEGRFGPLPEAVVQKIESATDMDRLYDAAAQVSQLAGPEDLKL